MKQVAIIGSFQRPENYALVQRVINLFSQNALNVTSPSGSSIANKREGFVIFDSDNHCLSNEKIQYDTLDKIFSSNAVYVVNADGYVGKTTCYEIGRVIERKIPIYFHSFPCDLPICITKDFIVAPEEFIDIVKKCELKIMKFECESCIKLQLCLGGTDD